MRRSPAQGIQRAFVDHAAYGVRLAMKRAQPAQQHCDCPENESPDVHHSVTLSHLHLTFLSHPCQGAQIERVNSPSRLSSLSCNLHPTSSPLIPKACNLHRRVCRRHREMASGKTPKMLVFGRSSLQQPGVKRRFSQLDQDPQDNRSRQAKKPVLISDMVINGRLNAIN